MNATLRQIVRKAIRLRYKFKNTPFGIRFIAWQKIVVFNLAYSLSKALSKLFGKPVSLTGIPPRFGPEPQEFEHEISVFLRAYNEATYLDEFICFHLAVGVDHIYVYDNNSQDNTAEVLAKYVAKGVVSHIVWPAKPPSPTADIDVVVRCREHSRWLMFVDTDEFVFPIHHETLPEALAEIKNHHGIALGNKFFGSSHFEMRPDGLTIENFTRCSDRIFRNTKSIVNPRHIIKLGNPHFWWLSGWKQSVLDNGKVCWMGLALEPSAEKIQLNHYYARSLEEYLKKIDPSYVADRNAVYNQTRVQTNVEKAFTENNEAEDLQIQRFLPKTKALMKEFGVEPYRRELQPEETTTPTPEP